MPTQDEKDATPEMVAEMEKLAQLVGRQFASKAYIITTARDVADAARLLKGVGKVMVTADTVKHRFTGVMVQRTRGSSQGDDILVRTVDQTSGRSKDRYIPLSSVIAFRVDSAEWVAGVQLPAAAAR
jgi:hypothetical protein